MNYIVSITVMAFVVAGLAIGCDKQAPAATAAAHSAEPTPAKAAAAAPAAQPVAAPPVAAPAAAAPAPQPGAEHAATGVVPGSHEDWCGEHGVPESQCTRCNPALVAAFKATGDWCKEHGLPESQCKVCNPKLKIERPAKAPAAQ